MIATGIMGGRRISSSLDVLDVLDEKSEMMIWVQM
jgi:hypothetical protein